MKKMMYFIVVLSVMCLLGCPVSNDTVKKVNWTFDSNGGEGKVEPITKEIGGEFVSFWEITLPYGNNLSKEGYYMCGWSVSPYGDKSNGNVLEGKIVSYLSSPLYDVSDVYNVTWYAIWRQVHTISIDANGGEGLKESIKYILGVPPYPINECITVPYNYSGYDLSDCMIKIYVSNIYDVDYSLGFERKVYPESFNTLRDGSGKSMRVYNFGDNKPYITIEPDILGDDITLYAIW